MATQGVQSNPGSNWGGLDDFLGVIDRVKNTVFDTWAQIDLFTEENDSPTGMVQDDSGGASGVPSSWSDPRDDNKALWIGAAVVGGIALILMLRK